MSFRVKNCWKQGTNLRKVYSSFKGTDVDTISCDPTFKVWNFRCSKISMPDLHRYP